ncbi:dethiobiotin synthase [Pseudorhodoplanes sinuspersici]|uniref:ATP-dependent dethiobiotin synthetase BioD n=1 Tax=Pseudorhodoplanes sinuspersici TaxID=1235591 RepID=A0A1W6ZRG4_9HYPH|nr:dethiobiotin synthase [Pseudorhodoplanes sinuspersici]ARP99865.1 dethiobiotin synthase [Pseudorhodoplanes sinuspersici]RKE70877.1 dethiobiotin synthetase [Pseudorhodoplanes sinuspersici]
MTAIFVTATGTDIGKTFVTSGLIRCLRNRKKDVDALKPIVSGFDPAHAGDSDSGVLLRALGLPLTDEEIEDISPWRFSAPLSPDMAARHEAKEIDFEQLLSFCETTIEETEGALLIEGVGGVMVPLDQSHTVLDWIAELGMPTIMVVGSYLGSISHTLTAAGALDGEDCDLTTIVVSETAGSHVPLYETVATISRFLPAIEVIALPRLEVGADHPAFEQIAKSAGLL